MFRVSKWWIVCASLAFYAWSAAGYLPVLAGSIIVNYLFGEAIRRRAGERARKRKAAGKAILLAGAAANVILLVYFKYAPFFADVINHVVASKLSIPARTLPLGISFFTFTQIAYLADVYREPDIQANPLDYCLFVAFFPRIISGPITRYREIMPSLAARERRVDYSALAAGLLLFSIGLFKKVVLVPPLAEWADNGFGAAGTLGLVEAWVTSISYTLQLYFDFSGYTDMALGAALMFNFRLPINFNSPYRATSIQDFWGRWHITLGRFLRDYVYIPLGGNRRGQLRTYGNLLATFLLCGLWHGAGGLFVFWGFLHGVALVVHRLWKRANLRMNTVAAWCLTFVFVNASWVFFRAGSWHDALEVLKGMAGLHGIKLPAPWETPLRFLAGRVLFTDNWLEATQGSHESVLVVAGLLLMATLGRTSDGIAKTVRPTTAAALVTGLLLFVSYVYVLSMDRQAAFIYFRF